MHAYGIVSTGGIHATHSLVQQQFASQSVAPSARLPRRKIDPVLSAAKMSAEIHAGFSNFGRHVVGTHRKSIVGRNDWAETLASSERDPSLPAEGGADGQFMQMQTPPRESASALLRPSGCCRAHTGFQLAAERQHVKETIIQRYLCACTHDGFPV